MYWLKPRDLWGDYGDVLFHGEAYTAREGGLAPVGSTVLQVCSPYSDVLLPYGMFLCTSRVVELLRSKPVEVQVDEVWVDRIVEVPIARWLKRGEPKYPRGGEPESYLEQYDCDRDFEQGFGNDFFHIHHDATIAISVPTWSKENRKPTPKIEGAWPANSHLVLGKRTQHSELGPLFCSEPFAEVMRAIECDNFELVQVSQ